MRRKAEIGLLFFYAIRVTLDPLPGCRAARHDDHVHIESGGPKHH